MAVPIKAVIAALIHFDGTTIRKLWAEWSASKLRKKQAKIAAKMTVLALTTALVSGCTSLHKINVGLYNLTHNPDIEVSPTNTK